MKNKILGSILLLAISLVAGVNISLKTNNGEISSLNLENVEALAQESLIDDGYYFCGVGGPGNDPNKATYGLYCGSCMYDTFESTGHGYCRLYKK
jgi:hypothetical protein